MSPSGVEEEAPKFVDVRLWDMSALVLMDWLLTTGEGALVYSHPGQKQALRDVLTALEWCVGLGYTGDELAAAQDRVARDMSEEDRDI